ncbi:MAG: trypsin-like peptidase domain-containing protein [Dehalococcoidales bacterium]|jgi:2-alkenal reductase|nr:trypsin-like peptidase domain-containing protein [Dehalococcoidales bacterium]
MNTFKGKLIAFLAILAIAIAAYTLGSSGILSPRNVSAAPVLYNEDTVASIYENASPAVFQINVTQTRAGISGTFKQNGQGTGFLIDKDGHILTNNHVVKGASSVYVVIDGDEVEAKVLGTDPTHDLAVIRIDPTRVAGINPLQLGDSDAVKPGQMAIAIGNPYGLDDTITVGVISGLNRNIGGMTGMIQTDATLNPGNSGGPLLNVNGQVIGINTAIESPFTGATNIGFAVPSNIAKAALPDLLAGKQVERPWIGISGRAITQSLATDLGLPINKGVYVVTVVPDSPADEAGLKGSGTDSSGKLDSDGDIITAVDGKPVASVEDISAYLNTKKVGDVIRLTIIRSGQSMEVDVTLSARPDNISAGTAPDVIPQPEPRPGLPWSDKWPFRLLPLPR